MLFEDFMKEVANKNLILAVELKEIGIEEETLNIINKYYDKEKVFITSFIYEVLSNVRKLDKDIKIGWLIEEDINRDNIKKINEIFGNQICPSANCVTREGIRLARENDLSVRLWEISNVEIMKKVYDLDIDGMTVNFPDELNKLMEKDK